MVYDDIDDDDNVLNEEPSTNDQIDNLEVDNQVDNLTSSNDLINNLGELEVDIIATLLNDRGVTDMSKLQFEDENGIIKEVAWNDLSPEELLLVLRTSTPDASDELDESEILFLNLLRHNNLSPNDYISYILNLAVENYKKSLEESSPYTVDLYSDDELYLYDLMNRTGITLEEAEEILANLKLNEAVFNKQVTALRASYKQLEDEYIKYNLLQDELKAQENFNRFAQSILQEVNNFNSVAGGSINMTNEDKNRLYEFLTGTDLTGKNWFEKALENPSDVVNMAWYLLYGLQAFQDILDYYNTLLLKLKNPTLNLKPISNIIYKPKSTKPSNNQVYDDLDDDF